ncbi:MAG: glycosyltransferase family 4 protein [Chloroflexi bacterium]|nr:glycosyltransferase family 4 protein [Chloroflexota bacterium]
MRVGIDYTSAVRQGAGIGRYTRGLIRALVEIDRTNRYVLFSAGRDPRGATWPANVAYRALPLTDRHLAILWQRLRLPLPVETITGRVDLFHSPDFVLPPVWRARTALTVHDLSFMRYPECSSPPLLEYLMRSVPRSVERADLVLADSESTRRDVIELLGIAEDRVRTLYAGVEERFSRPAEPDAVEAVRRRYGIARPYILGLGTLQPRKNFPALIRAYHALRETHGVEHQLVIGGGRGWLDDEIYATIDALGLEGDVLLPGYVDDADLPALYTGAAVFAFPSLYEGFGIPILEAMACGTPVVSADASSLPEVTGDAALLVSPHDVEALAHALWRLLDDGDLRETLVERGRQRVALFRWEAAARTLLEAYASLAG